MYPIRQVQQLFFTLCFAWLLKHRRSNSADFISGGFGLPGIEEETPSKTKLDRERRFSSPGVSDAGMSAAHGCTCLTFAIISP